MFVEGDLVRLKESPHERGLILKSGRIFVVLLETGETRKVVRAEFGCLPRKLVLRRISLDSKTRIEEDR